MLQPARDDHQRSPAKASARAATRGEMLRSPRTRPRLEGAIAPPAQAMASASQDPRMRSAINVASRATSIGGVLVPEKMTEARRHGARAARLRLYRRGGQDDLGCHGGQRPPLRRTPAQRPDVDVLHLALDDALATLPDDALVGQGGEGLGRGGGRDRGPSGNRACRSQPERAARQGGQHEDLLSRKATITQVRWDPSPLPDKARHGGRIEPQVALRGAGREPSLRHRPVQPRLGNPE